MTRQNPRRTTPLTAWQRLREAVLQVPGVRNEKIAAARGEIAADGYSSERILDRVVDRVSDDLSTLRAG